METKTELITFLEKRNWIKDKFGHLQIQASNGKKYRIKFQKISFRLEVQSKTIYSEKNHWLRLRSGYLSQIEIIGGKIKGILYGMDLEVLFNATVILPPEIQQIFQ